MLSQVLQRVRAVPDRSAKNDDRIRGLGRIGSAFLERFPLPRRWVGVAQDGVRKIAHRLARFLIIFSPIKQ